MAIDLYGTKPIGALQSVAQTQQKQTGGKLLGMFTRSASKGAYGAREQVNTQRLNEAIQAFGTDVLLNWKERSAQLGEAVQEDLKNMSIQMQQARAANDMEMYKLALQQSLFDKQLLAHKDSLDKARFGDIMTGIIAGLGQLAAGGIEAWQDKKAYEETQQMLNQWKGQSFGQPSDYLQFLNPTAPPYGGRG